MLMPNKFDVQIRLNFSIKRHSLESSVDVKRLWLAG